MKTKILSIFMVLIFKTTLSFAWFQSKNDSTSVEKKIEGISIPNKCGYGIGISVGNCNFLEDNFTFVNRYVKHPSANDELSTLIQYAFTFRQILYSNKGKLNIAFDVVINHKSISISNGTYHGGYSNVSYSATPIGYSVTANKQLYATNWLKFSIGAGCYYQMSIKNLNYHIYNYHFLLPIKNENSVFSPKVMLNLESVLFNHSTSKTKNTVLLDFSLEKFFPRNYFYQTDNISYPVQYKFDFIFLIGLQLKLY